MYTQVKKSPHSPTPQTYQRGQRGLSNQFDTTYQINSPPPTVCAPLPPPPLLPTPHQCSQGKRPERSQMLKDTIRNVPTDMSNIITDNCPKRRAERVGESVYLQIPKSGLPAVCG